MERSASSGNFCEFIDGKLNGFLAIFEEVLIGMKETKWISIGIISIVMLVISIILTFFTGILVYSIALISVVLIVCSVIVLVREQVFRYFVIDRVEQGVSLFMTAVVLVPIVLVVSVVLDFARTFFPLPFYPYCPEYRGVEYYEDEAYTRFRYGKKAEKYLPDYGELEGVESLDFYYSDLAAGESLFYRNGITVFMLRVEYTDEQYAEEKEHIVQNGIDYSHRFISTLSYHDVWLLDKEELVLNCMYSMAKCFDEQHTVIYFVTVEDSSDLEHFGAFDWDGGSYVQRDIWQEVENPR